MGGCGRPRVSGSGQEAERVGVNTRMSVSHLSLEVLVQKRKVRFK